MAAILDSSTVHLELDGQPESVALVRAMLAGVSEGLELERELLDGLNTTVSEACNNVIKHAYEGSGGPMIVHLSADAQCVEATIRDRGAGLDRRPPPEDHVGVGLALISALANRSEFLTHPEGGTEVRIGFDRRPRSEDGPRWREQRSARALARAMPGDVTGTLAPVNLLGSVLGRMGRLLAARARFSITRFSDLYLLFDQLAFHAARRATGPGMTFSMSAGARRLELELGPLDASTGNGSDAVEWREAPRNLRVLTDELTLKPVDDGLVLRMVVGGADARAEG